MGFVMNLEFKLVVEQRLVLNGCLDWIATTAKNEIQVSVAGLTYYCYALTASPTIRTSCIKQFWTMAKVSVPRKRRGVVIQDPEETTSTVVVHSEVQSKDKGK
nr:hypothetical protein [Tanacetum cinerariifolium]